VEPDYKVKYPNLALCKLSTKLKKEGHTVKYYKGMEPFNFDTLDNPYDEIYITTLFTYESDKCIETINHYKKTYPNAKVHVGGIFASLMPEYIEEKTGIKPFMGYSKELDRIKPDFDLIRMDNKWDDFSIVFTSRGCVNKCKFCAVPRIEDKVWINPNWKDSIDLNRGHLMVHDNNLTAMPIEHFKEVCNFIREHDLKVMFDNGFDCRHFTDAHLEALGGLRIIDRGIRFAFDTMAVGGKIEKVIQKCLDGGIQKKTLMVYVLYNFKDTPQEAEYRARQIVKLGVSPYPQRYMPLDALSKKPWFIGKHWTQPLARIFRFFYLMRGYYSKQTFPEWLEGGEWEHLLKDFHNGGF
jgi:hypothetical protein